MAVVKRSQRRVSCRRRDETPIYVIKVKSLPLPLFFLQKTATELAGTFVATLSVVCRLLCHSAFEKVNYSKICYISDSFGA